MQPQLQGGGGLGLRRRAWSPSPCSLPRSTAGARVLLRTCRWQQTFYRCHMLRAWQQGRLQLLENVVGVTSTAKHPVTFLCLECNLFLEALLENLNLVSHQLFIIREAYV